MKKLLVMSAIVVVAFCANAASINWGGAICAEDGVTAPNSGTIAYLLYSDSAFGAISEFNSATKTTNAGGTMVDQYTITATDAANYAFQHTYSNPDYTAMNGYYAMVLVDGTTMYYNTFQVTEFTSGTTPPQNKQINMDWSGSEFLGDPAKKGTVSVPEPTSGLLMLVGLSALALRRRKQA